MLVNMLLENNKYTFITLILHNNSWWNKDKAKEEEIERMVHNWNLIHENPFERVEITSVNLPAQLLKVNLNTTIEVLNK